MTVAPIECLEGNARWMPADAPEVRTPGQVAVANEFARWDRLSRGVINAHDAADANTAAMNRDVATLLDSTTYPGVDRLETGGGHADLAAYLAFGGFNQLLLKARVGYAEWRFRRGLKLQPNKHQTTLQQAHMVLDGSY